MERRGVPSYCVCKITLKCQVMRTCICKIHTYSFQRTYVGRRSTKCTSISNTSTPSNMIGS